MLERGLLVLLVGSCMGYRSVKAIADVIKLGLVDLRRSLPREGAFRRVLKPT